MRVIRYTSTHGTILGLMESVQILSRFKDFIDWSVEFKDDEHPYHTLHVYLRDDGSNPLPGNCERVDFTACQDGETVVQLLQGR